MRIYFAAVFRSFLVFLVRLSFGVGAVCLLVYLSFPILFTSYVQIFHKVSVESARLSGRELSIARMQADDHGLDLKGIRVTFDWMDVLRLKINSVEVEVETVTVQPPQKTAQQTGVAPYVEQLRSPVLRVENFHVQKFSYLSNGVALSGEVKGSLRGRDLLQLSLKGRLDDVSLTVDLEWPKIEAVAAKTLTSHQIDAHVKGVFQSDHLEVSGVAKDSKLGECARMAGKLGYDLKGQFDFKIPQKTYGSPVLDLGEYRPSLLQEFSVGVEGQGVVFIQQGDLSAQGQLKVHNGFLLYDKSEVRGIQATVDLAQIDFQQQAYRQPIFVQLVRTPVAVFTGTDLTMSFKEKSVVLESLKTRLWEGEVTAKNVKLYPFSVPQTLRLDATNLDLSKLISDLQMETLNANGRVSGRLPVTVYADGDFEIKDAKLKSNSGGNLSYRWNEGLSSENTNIRLAAQALNDFLYDKLVIKINKPKGGQMAVKLDLDGKNPKVLEGRPFDININISGDLLDALQATIGSIQGDIRSFNLKEQMDRGNQ